ncbi:hypothetical protein [Tamlana sp. I1]|uniref:hypothetical protein n=1 Tax=Tamlana sp. I1 TaxID=2762061 RepID=UPI00188ED616|nr:hypothetical protein [Tamlana sp. I1]
MNTKNHLKLTFIAILLTLTFGCKKQQTFTNFNYADQPDTVTCEGVNSKLLKEALYSFEDDILKFAQKNNPKTNLTQAYNQFLRLAVYNRINFQEMVSLHTLEVFEALKKENDLWDPNNKVSHLNYKGKVVDCISNNIQDNQLKTTFNALLSTNSLSPRLFCTPVMQKYRNALSDKYLATYLALDLYYTKLFNVDFSEDKEQKEETTK